MMGAYGAGPVQYMRVHTLSGQQALVQVPSNVGLPGVQRPLVSGRGKGKLYCILLGNTFFQ